MKAAPWVRAIVGWVFLPFRLNYGPSVSPKNSTAYQDAVSFRRTVNEGYATRAMLQAAPTGIRGPRLRTTGARGELRVHAGHALPSREIPHDVRPHARRALA